MGWFNVISSLWHPRHRNVNNDHENVENRLKIAVITLYLKILKRAAIKMVKYKDILGRG